MSVHSINHQQAALSPISQATNAPAKSTTSGTFGKVFGTYLPSSSEGIPTAPASAASQTGTGFAALFSNYNPETTASSVAPSASAPFTAAYQTGATVTDPTGAQTNLNPIELATPATAAEVAQLLGGTVVSSPMAGGFSTSVPTLEVSVPGAKNEINAGVAASLFAQYGTAQGSMAWSTIDQDLGIG
jgi:hypothetical protein